MSVSGGTDSRGTDAGAAPVFDVAFAAAWMREFAARVAAQRDELTELDAAIGDADHGVNMDRGMLAVVAKLPAGAGPMGGAGAGSGAGAASGAAEEAQDPPLGPFFKTVGMTLVSTVGGAAGPLYGTLFLEFGKAAGERSALSEAEVAGAFAAAVAGVQARGKAEAGDKTMVDALLPARDALAAAAGAGDPLPQALRAAAEAAEEGMRATTPLVARKGRASYLGERSAGHQDPGATSTSLLLGSAAALAGASA